MSLILKKKSQAAIPSVSADYVDVFVDSLDGVVKYKDENGDLFTTGIQGVSTSSGTADEGKAPLLNNNGILPAGFININQGVSHNTSVGSILSSNSSAGVTNYSSTYIPTKTEFVNLYFSRGANAGNYNSTNTIEKYNGATRDILYTWSSSASGDGIVNIPMLLGIGNSYRTSSYSSNSVGVSCGVLYFTSILN